MRAAPSLRRTRSLLTAIVCVGVLLAGFLWYQASARTSHTSTAQQSVPVERSPAVVVQSDQGWKTIAYRSVRVDIPATWQRVDTGDCEFGFEHWAPPGALRCDVDRGLAFYASATFDTGHEPGLRATDHHRWGGYTYAGDLAVYAAGPDRDAVRRVLTSAHAG